ncbi:YtxH domain-containing protein [Nonomuraea longicatena]|uniref:YtxH domain-containing protein n=1 Tax=Nonomuraea longicatena TaxID=83682 RepID=A0ABN1R837_9ACTN
MRFHAARTGQRLAPMADQAKVVAAQRFEDARYWAAPRLEHAAHRVEDQIAPAVSAMLTQAAGRIDPTPPKSRRWPLIALVIGIAIGVAGYLVYRRNAQDWTEQMKDSAEDASQWVGEKAEKVSDSADNIASTANEKARKMS